MLDRTGANDKSSDTGGPDVAGWYDEYHGRLLSYLRHSLRAECDVQDVSQEVFLRLLRVPEHRAIDHPRAYLFRVAANVVNDWRAGQRLFETRDPEVLDQIPDYNNIVEDYDQKKRDLQIRNAIKSLPPLYRAALLLKVQHSMNYREIAAHLNVSERMVKRYIVKAYAKLREELSGLAQAGS